jgi:hypothetical protein
MGHRHFSLEHILWPAKALGLIAFAVLVTGCGEFNKYNAKHLQPATSLTVQVVGTPPKAKLENLKDRPTVAQGAGAGAVSGAGEAIGEAFFTDPGMILLVPIMIPVGAVIGAASVPNDEEWKEIVAYYERSTRISKLLQGIAARSVTAAQLEREFVREVPKHWQGCVTSASRKGKCRAGANPARLQVKLEHEIRPFKYQQGAFWSSDKRIVESYIYSSNLTVKTHTTGDGVSECYRIGFRKSYEADEFDTLPEQKAVMADLASHNRVIASFVSTELYSLMIDEDKAAERTYKAIKARLPEGWGGGLFFPGCPT